MCILYTPPGYFSHTIKFLGITYTFPVIHTDEYWLCSLPCRPDKRPKPLVKHADMRDENTQILCTGLCGTESGFVPLSHRKRVFNCRPGASAGVQRHNKTFDEFT